MNKNDNGTYTLYGKIITVDTSKEQIAEIPFYKETGEYKKITLSSDTKYEGEIYNEEKGYIEEINDTVGNVFSKKLNEKDGVKIAYTFEFKNGKCILISEVEIGH